MSTDNFNQTPFLRTSRNFPIEAKQLTVEMNKAYVDIANVTNSKTSGIFATNRPMVSADSWFFGNNNQPNFSQKQQGIRQVFEFTSTGNIAHNIPVNSIVQIGNSFGSFTDGTNFYGLIYASNTTIVGQVTFYVTATNIVIQAGAGAPSITSGYLVLQWITNV
jgi:hypothetical protein